MLRIKNINIYILSTSCTSFEQQLKSHITSTQLWCERLQSCPGVVFVPSGHSPPLLTKPLLNHETFLIAQNRDTNVFATFAQIWVFFNFLLCDSVLKSGTKLCDARCKNPLQPPPHAAHSIRMIRGMSKFYLRIKRSQLRLFSLNIICLGGKYFHVFPIPKFS